MELIEIFKVTFADRWIFKIIASDMKLFELNPNHSSYLSLIRPTGPGCRISQPQHVKAQACVLE